MKIRRSLWHNGTVYGEPLLFTEKYPAQLSFVPEEILGVYNSVTGQWFREGMDWIWKGGRTLFRSENSAIACWRDEDLYPPQEKAIPFPKENANAISGGPGGKKLAFTHYDLFLRNQVEVLYRTAEKLPVYPAASPEKLSRSRNMKKLRLAVTGDSISCGFNSSGFLNFPPFMPCYFDQFAEALRDSGIAVETKNFAVNGSTSADGIEKLKERFDVFLPDLLIVAFGMNNIWGTAKEYGKSIRILVDNAKKLNPELELILVSSFPRNPEWRPEVPPGPGRDFAGELFSIAANDPAIAVADVNDAWNNFADRKNYLDLSGNGVNHPNDFGHRLYASVLAALWG